MDVSPNLSPNPKSPIRRFCERVLSPSRRSPPSTPPSPATNSNSDVERVFRYIDENGDGKISPSELRSCLKTVAGGSTDVLSSSEAQAAVESSDSDGDGYLSLEDLQRIMAAEGVPEEDRTAELREAFSMYEMEGSGRITARSLRKMMSRLGESRSIRECEGMISRFDLDGDGVLSFEEFAAMMR